MGKVTFNSNNIKPPSLYKEDADLGVVRFTSNNTVPEPLVMKFDVPQLVQTIEYRDVIKEVIIEKIVEIEKPIEIIKEVIKEIPVEKIVTVYEIVEKPIEKIVEKEVIVRVENPIDFIKCQENRDLVKKTNNQRKAIQALGLISVTLLIMLIGALIYGK